MIKAGNTEENEAAELMAKKLIPPPSFSWGILGWECGREHRIGLDCLTVVLGVGKSKMGALLSYQTTLNELKRKKAGTIE